jgi:hypothetical protein
MRERLNRRSAGEGTETDPETALAATEIAYSG